jgi:hypothetical protein
MLSFVLHLYVILLNSRSPNRIFSYDIRALFHQGPYSRRTLRNKPCKYSMCRHLYAVTPVHPTGSSDLRFYHKSIWCSSPACAFSLLTFPNGPIDLTLTDKPHVRFERTRTKAQAGRLHSVFVQPRRTLSISINPLLRITVSSDQVLS